MFLFIPFVVAQGVFVPLKDNVCSCVFPKDRTQLMNVGDFHTFSKMFLPDEHVVNFHCI